MLRFTGSALMRLVMESNYFEAMPPRDVVLKAVTSFLTDSPFRQVIDDQATTQAERVILLPGEAERITNEVMDRLRIRFGWKVYTVYRGVEKFYGTSSTMKEAETLATDLLKRTNEVHSTVIRDASGNTLARWVATNGKANKLCLA